MGAGAGLTIAIAALVINVTQVPLAIVLIGAGGGSKAQPSVLSTVLGTFKQPVVIAPLVALALLPAVGLGLLTVFGVTGASQAQAVVSAISSGLILASRYKTYVDQAASTVLLSAVGMAAALSLWILLLPKS